MSRHFTGWLAALMLVGLASGCGPERIYFTDSVDLAFDFDAWGHDDEALHQPYLRGADLEIGIHSRYRDEDFRDWTVAIEDESVIALDYVEIDDDRDDLYAGVTTLAEGVTEIQLFNPRGKLVASAPLEVALPDRAELRPHGPLLIDREDLIDDDDAFQLLDGGLATFQVRFHRGDQRLYGNGTLTAVGDGDVDIDVEESFLFEDRDWIQVASHGVGVTEIELSSDGRDVDTVQIHTVSDDAIDDVRLHAEAELLVEEGATLTVLAEARDGGGRPIYGVEFTWEVDGVLEPIDGDLYRYEFDPDQTRELTAMFGDATDTITIHSEDGHVSSTNIIGCNAAASRAAGAGAALCSSFAVLALAVTLVRRRR